MTEREEVWLSNQAKWLQLHGQQIRFSPCSYGKLTASHDSRYHNRLENYLLKMEKWKKREVWWKELALSQTWMDPAQLIKIKRFNSREIKAAIQCARHTWAILISSQPARSSTFWCETIFCIFNYTLQQPSNYQNQAHLHDWNIIMAFQKKEEKNGSVLVPVTILCTPPPPAFLLKSVIDDGPITDESR